MSILIVSYVFFFFQAEDGIRDKLVTGVQTCALPISAHPLPNGDPGMLRLAPRECLEHELLAGQHVGVDGRERRSQPAQALTGELQQLLPRAVAYVAGA